VASSKRELCGVLPVFQTPYHPDETIDYDTLEREIAWLHDCGAHGIGPRLSELREATRGRARAFEGSGGIALVDSFRRGIVGTMPGADLIRGLVPLWRALEAGHTAKADRIHGPLAAVISMQTSLDAFLAVEKHLLVRQGIFKNALVRGPVGFRLDEGTRREVDRLFDRLIEAAQQTTGTN
jgi:4-hydroxy-tetrahydrodipicolinate synthase